STGHTQPKATTKTIIALEKPSTRIAGGRMADAGSGRRNSALGWISLLSSDEDAIAAPSATPATHAASHPATMRHTVAPSGCQSAPVVIHSHSLPNERSGPGNQSGLTSFASAASFQAKSSARKKPMPSAV